MIMGIVHRLRRSLDRTIRPPRYRRRRHCGVGIISNRRDILQGNRRSCAAVHRRSPISAVDDVLIDRTTISRIRFWTMSKRLVYSRPCVLRGYRPIINRLTLLASADEEPHKKADESQKNHTATCSATGDRSDVGFLLGRFGRCYTLLLTALGVCIITCDIGAPRETDQACPFCVFPCAEIKKRGQAT